jgi:hypothetical protein
MTWNPGKVGKDEVRLSLTQSSTIFSEWGGIQLHLTKIP